MKLSVIIPVLDEAETFESLLKKVLDVPIPKEIIIVEGGSTDGTTALVRKYRSYKDKNNTIKTFFVTEHYGKGYKVRYGLKKATGDIILIQDADLEYDPREYKELIAPIIARKTDFVLGSRHLHMKTWKIREFAHSRWYERAHILNVGDHMLKLYFALLYGKYLTDPNTMFKVFRKSALRGITLRSNNFELDLELVIKLLKSGHNPIEVPVSYKGRGRDEGKKIRVIRDGARALWTMTKLRFSD